jgi:UDP-N-acetyl-D-glucosamine dehydrogenase
MGQGYVGLPLAMRAVEVGHQVVGYDTDGGRVKRLNAGESFVEDVSNEQVARALHSGRFTVESDPSACAGFDVAVITVPTPLREGAPDLSFVKAACETLAPAVGRGTTVVLESTSYPGTTEEFVAPLLEAGSALVAGIDFFLGYSPERIDPGNKVWTFANTPKLVSGVDRASLAAVQAFYDTIVDQTVAVTGTREAELAKLLENTFRHVNIALVNELAMFAKDLDIDVWQVIDAASSKPFGFARFTPGPGVGGHCLPIDPSYLSWRVRRRLGRPFRFVDLANDVNDHMPDYVVQRLTVALNRDHRPVNGSRILLLGLAYKRNTGDARQSPALVVAERLLSLGADVRGADPYVDEAHVDRRIGRVEASPQEMSDADAVVILTDHDAFDLDGLAPHARYILDTRHCVASSAVVEYL